MTTYTPFAASCQGSALGQVSTSDLNSAITSVAPSFVPANSNYTIKLTPDPMPIPSSGGGQTIQNLNTLRIRFPVPANSTFVSATVTGGSNIGSGVPTVAQAAGVITLTVPGPLAAGSTATLPTVNLTLKATGAAGTSIKTAIAGSSYANPGITFNVKINLFGLTVATNCYVTTTPAPVFSSTPIS